MREDTPKREWKGLALLFVVAAGVLLWSIGLPGRWRSGGDDFEAHPARRTAERLAAIAPEPDARVFPRWRELSRLGPPDEATSGALGFDALRLIIGRRDADVAWQVALLIDETDGEPRPVAAAIECTSEAPGSLLFVHELARDWPHPTERTPGGWRATWRHPRAAAELEARARRVLGGHSAAALPEGGVRNAYWLLIDPLRPLVFAPAHDPRGGGLSGRRAIETLIRADRADLVRNVLRGLDPEGRLYAAEALLERIEKQPRDEYTLREVLGLGVGVRVLGSADERLGALTALGR